VTPTGSLRRRELILSAGATAFLSCSRSERTPLPNERPSTPLVSSQVRTLEWDLGPQPWGAARASIVVPTWGGPTARFPVLVALHGRGEALKPPAEGALGWPRDYALVRAFERLRSPPLLDADYGGLVDPDRMSETNASLARHPLGGLVVACPWLPDLSPVHGGEVAAYAKFVLEGLLPRVRRETPACPESAATGIDGVSLGGAVALRIGLSFPEAFGSVGGIQPALSENQGAEWTALAVAARTRHPALKLRLLTSHDDFFRGAIVGVSRAWQAAGIGHDFAEVVGPHDYSFNRGPGSIELLLWHDRVLRCA
jgi:hypothetical protein